MEHSFDTDFAKEYGVVESVVIKHFVFWINKNIANGRNFIDGKYWTYNSTKAFTLQFPYLSEHQIFRLLKKLEKTGVIVSANYNKTKFDKTKWYAFSDEFFSVLRFRKMVITNPQNGCDDIAEPIPDTNTYTITDKEETTKEVSAAAVPALESNNLFPSKVSKASKSNRTDEEFEKVWNLYDKKGSKKASKAKWMKLKDDEVAQCMNCIPQYMNANERQYRKDFQAFLNQKVWEGKLYKFGKCIYDPDEVQESLESDVVPRGATSYPKGPDGIYTSHNDNPRYGVIFDGYNDNNRPEGTKIRYCGQIYVWNPKIDNFELEQ